MRCISLAVAVLILAGCPTAGGTYRIARGAGGKFPAGQTGCRNASPESGRIVAIEDGRFYRAIGVGKAEIHCTDDKLIMDVRQVARIELVHRASYGGYDVIALEVFDDSGTELSLGNFTEIDWRIPDTVEQRSGCHGHIIPSCDPSYVLGVRPIKQGDHTVTVRFAGHQASIDLDRLERPTSR